METVRKLYKIMLSYLNSCLEFTFFSESLIHLPKYFDKIKQKLESEADTIKFIYFNSNWFHNVLYKKEQIVKIKNEEQKKNLYYCFYLDLLIVENPLIINYTYSLDFIKTINTERKKTSQKYKLIIFSKIILDLIDNYEGTDEYNENEESIELEEIKKENRQIIKDNIEIFKEIGLYLNEDDILKKKIDEIYLEIINALIRSKKIEDFEYAYIVLEQLDLKNINLTKTIFEGLINGQNYKDYEINNVEDLNDEKKVNFYYLFFTFIFKTSIYIYNIPFLLKTQKIFLYLIKQKKAKYLKVNLKLEYIILKIIDSKFYSSKYYENIYEILNEVLKYYEECLFETKIEDIKIIKDIMKNKNIDYIKYLEDYDKAKIINERIPIINYIYNLENKGNFRNEKNYQKALIKLDNFERMIKERNLEKEYGEMMANFIKDKNNNKILSKILNKNENDYFINYIKENINNINKNVNELMINENENIPFKNEEEIKYNKKEKRLEINRSSNNHVITIKNEDNLDTVCCPEIKDKKEDFAFYLLKKCSIKFHTNLRGKEPYIIYDEIICGEHDTKIDYKKLMNIKSENSHQKNELSDNILKLFKFIKETENRICNEFLWNYKLRIKLDIRKENYNNNDSTYNISCLYIFYDPIDNSIYKYKDENILINGTNSLNQGFQFMLYQINSECYKNLEYKKFDIIYKSEPSIVSYLLETDFSRTEDIYIKMIGQNINK